LPPGPGHGDGEALTARAYFLTNREHSRAMSITLIESVESYEVVLTATAANRD
jgi:hypothetical protein